MRDPRDLEPVSGRDLEAGAFIGEGYEVAQYQLQEAVFKGRSPTVASRFVTRWARRGLLVAERLFGIGMNRLRLTSKGRDLLVRHGVDERDLFVPRKPTALKDLAHRLWINDVRVVFGEFEPRPDRIIPAWVIERRLGGSGKTIPDVLVVRREPQLTLALEVDLGSEPLRSVFAKKLALLAKDFLGLGSRVNSMIVVLTSSARRAAALREILGDSLPVSVVVETLPDEAGPAALRALRAMWSEGAKASPQDRDANIPPLNELASEPSCRLGHEAKEKMEGRERSARESFCRSFERRVRCAIVS